MLIGCIADDLTGATDLGVTLAREGLSVVQVNGIPAAGFALPAVDAVVVALKSRTIPAQDAIRQSLAALDWLRGHGAERIYFKYCSTFDSTPQGNIGPVTEALQAALGAGSRRRRPRTRATSGPSTSGTCSSGTCCCPIRACATTR